MLAKMTHRPLIDKLKLTLALGLLLGFCTFGQGWPGGGLAHAQELTDRSVRLSTYAVAAAADYTFTFSVPTTSTIGSIEFKFCDNSPVFDQTCSAPAGLDAAGATLGGSQTGNTGFSLDGADTTANRLVISRAVAGGSAAPSSYVFNGVTNPSTVGQTVFVRIATYSSTDGSGSMNDNGAVAYVTAQSFNVDAFVPPYLKLCVGLSVAANCTSATGDSIDFGNLKNTKPSDAVSQFAAGTNSQTGYTIFALGTTMTSGNNTIPALPTPDISRPGTGQFGINLRANSSPAIGSNPSGPGTATPTSGYNSPNHFKFPPGDAIASYGQPTDFNRMTVSYMVNVGSAQPVGIYSATISYLIIAQF